MSGPLPDWLRPVTIPASWGFRAAVRARNRHYDQPDAVRHLDIPVISVGNLSTGGAGKTPTVMWIVEQLRAHERMPVIALRGYGAGPGELSDEETEYMQRLPDTDIVVDPKRYEKLNGYLAKRPEIDCAVLDDGFQHRQLHRDLDLVLVDSTQPTFHDRLLPAGHLREPLRNLSRADAVIVTRCDAPDDELAALIETYHGALPLAWCRHRWTHLDRYDVDGAHTRPVEDLRTMRLAVMAGIGNPAAFRRQLEQHGATIAVERGVRDHFRYTSRALAEVHEIARKCDALVVTGKDWVKIEPLVDWSTWTVPIVLPRVAVDVHHGEAALRQRLLEACPVRSAVTADGAHD